MLEEDIICEKTIIYVNEIEGYSVTVYKYESVEMYITNMWGIA